MKYLLDTNALSEPLKQRPNSHILKMIKANDAHLATASVVWHELWFGCQRLPESSKRTDIHAYLVKLRDANLPVLPYTKTAAAWHGSERARLQQAGLSPSFADGQIAAIAYENSLTVVTRNTSDFKIFQGIKIEDWFGS